MKKKGVKKELWFVSNCCGEKRGNDTVYTFLFFLLLFAHRLLDKCICGFNIAAKKITTLPFM